MLLSRYVIAEIARPLFAACLILSLVFAGYRSAIDLTDAANGLIQPLAAVKLVLLETLIAFEVLLPTALYLSVVIGLGRLHRDSEITALQATGVGESALLGAVFRFSLLVAIIVAALSLVVRPWAYQKSYELEAAGIAATDVTELDAERFYPLLPTHNVLFAENIDRKHHRMRGVFLEGDQGERRLVVYAREASRLSGTGAARAMRFETGRAYDIGRSDSSDRLFRFETLTIKLADEPAVAVRQSRKAEPTRRLLGSERPKDIAEIQWRLTTPMATVLLALVGVPLSRTSPRQKRHGGIVIATLAYAVFFNLAGIARNWVEQGVVGPVPGLWWIYLIPAGLLLVLLWRPAPGFRVVRQRRQGAGR